jgi:hypothetical protein
LFLGLPGLEVTWERIKSFFLKESFCEKNNNILFRKLLYIFLKPFIFSEGPKKGKKKEKKRKEPIYIQLIS